MRPAGFDQPADQPTGDGAAGLHVEQLSTVGGQPQGEPVIQGVDEYQPSHKDVSEPGTSSPLNIQLHESPHIASPQPVTLDGEHVPAVVSPGDPPARDEAGRWVPGVSGNTSGRRGPLVTPHLTRYLQMSVGDLRRLKRGIHKLRAGEAIALTMALDALSTGKLETGDKSRQAILDRIDGPVKDDSNRGNAVQVNIIQHGGQLGV